MAFGPHSRIVLRDLCLLLLAFFSVGFYQGMAGCDQPPSVEDSVSTDTGNPVDVGSGNPSTGNPPPGGGNTGDEPPPPPNNNAVQNVILLVGSGMGPQQLGQIVQYRRLRMPTEDKLAIEKLMDKKTMGLVSTHSYLDLVSDSAAANSAMACGLKVRNSTVGTDANGNPCETVLEKAMAMGKATGLVSNVNLSHPGIAAFAAHRLTGEDQNGLAADILQNKEINVLLAGGMKHLTPQKMSEVAGCESVDAMLDGPSARQDNTDLIAAAKEKGYQFACSLEQLNGLQPSTDSKVLGIFSSGAFPRSPDRKALSTLPSLGEMSQKALEILDQNENGFFLVIHGGTTHLAAQDNDAGSMLQEGLDFDIAVAAALDFADKNPDTLLIFTGDHETGGFGFAASDQTGAELDLPSGDHYDAPFNYAPLRRLDLLMEQNKSFYALTGAVLEKLYSDHPELNLDTASEMLVSEVGLNTPYSLSLGDAREILDRPGGAENAKTQDFSEFFVHENVHSNLLGRKIARQISAVWASGTPTSTPVIILATGPEQYAKRVQGFIDNTEVGKIILDALAGL